MVIFGILIKNVSYELKLLGWILQPLHQHPSVMPNDQKRKLFLK